MKDEIPRRTPTDSRASLAVDLGAESCRVSLLRWVHGEPELRLVHRFPNAPVRAADNSLRWPLQAILDGVELGIRHAAELAPEGIGSIAVDGWAVDYVRLDADGRALEDPFCYRDERNTASASALHGRISRAHMREITGIEQQPINTLYQLYADKLSGKASDPLAQSAGVHAAIDGAPSPWPNTPTPRTRSCWTSSAQTGATRSSARLSST